MKKDGYYSSGEFARMAHITLRTVRYYDKQNILKPSFLTASGARFYSDADFAKLQQILLLKYLGFSLESIREMTIGDSDYRFLQSSLTIQLKLVRERIEQMQLVEKAIQDTTFSLSQEQSVDWTRMLDLIHLTNIESSLKNQYQNASNISARINLHKLFSQNKQGWFPWIYEKMNLSSGKDILEIGCGDGTLWVDNIQRLPSDIKITLSDISEGMLRDARRNIGIDNSIFYFASFDCSHMPYPNSCFDLLIANHVLFYCDDLTQVLKEVQRVLKPNGIFICSAYGKNHMKEINELMQSFDPRISLSAKKLYDSFGYEIGQTILSSFFDSIEWVLYEDALTVTEPEPFISYVLSCHGNQNQYILDRYQEFRTFVTKRTAKGLHITKEAGIFLCKKTED